MSSPVLPDDLQSDVPAVIVPDRADAPISEITERFFRALLLKVPLDRIEELHLFSPLRQGGVETGIAVIAAREVIVPPAVEPSVEDPELPLQEASLEDVSESAMESATESAAESATESDAVEAVAVEASAVEAGADEAGAADDIAADAAAVDAVAADIAPETEADDSPYADAPDADAPDIATSSAEISDDTSTMEPLPDSDVPETAIVAPPTPVIRHTVFTARYRLVQKGPERGKWEADVVAEAEAPLITVETVVRGVQRRAGEESDTTRFTAPQIARALRLDLGAA